ncbi:MAG: LamG-like jellyroll fold domain-containing protein [Bacteroidales bacterium]|nr:LamG-like jellyroll fold domain-containing protein [Bacteroidales bacterium]
MTQTRTLLGLFLLLMSTTAVAQELVERTPHSSQWMLAPTAASTRVNYQYHGEGIEYRVRWGMDTAWNNRNNIVRGTYHIGSENLSYGRVSFQPSDSVGDDFKLSNAQQRNLTNRINNMKRTGSTRVLLNCDHAANNADKLAANYYGKPKNWYRMLKAHVLEVQRQGLTVEAIAPMNEPDYTNTGQGSREDFRQICKLLREDPFFDNIRISAGNTLNTDPALEWYNYMKPYVDEGNTHQLAGSFDNYANFFQTVRADGNVATADELHNTMEAFVAVEYGLQNGIWWGYEGVTRGRYCKATSGGRRLGYGESRATWTAGCVYRLPDGSVDAFLGSSERQANTNTFELACQDRDVFYDGYGPTRLFGCEIPGGTGYQIGQTNAETTIHITEGADVANGPIVNGQYFLMNIGTGQIMSTSNNSDNAAMVTVANQAATTRTDEVWTIEAVPARVGGDFCYHFITNNMRNRLLDVYNSNLNDNGNICAYPGGKGAIEQWHFIYAGNGDYYIQSRFSGLFLGINTWNNRVVQQFFSATNATQRWRLVPSGAKCETTPPAVPVGLTATPQSASILLQWEANTDADIASYTILRGEATTDEGENWQTIGRQITGTQFIDNSCAPDRLWLYKIIAVDVAGNRSAGSSLVSAQPSNTPALICHYNFDKNTLDDTENQFDAVADVTPAYQTTDALHKEGTASLMINSAGTGKRYLSLPHEVGNLSQMTFAMWLRWRGGNANQPIFDFAAGPDQYVNFTPSDIDGQMKLSIKNGDTEQALISETGFPKNVWHHVAVTMSDSEVTLYVDGEVVASSDEITLRPRDIRPVLCCIGRAPYANTPFLVGYIDDLNIYNYSLTTDEILTLMNGGPTVVESMTEPSAVAVVATQYYTLDGQRTQQPVRGLYIVKQTRSDGSVTTKKVLR